jgi:hypothetical protein
VAARPIEHDCHSLFTPVPQATRDNRHEVTIVKYIGGVVLILMAAAILVCPLTTARLSAQKDVETTGSIVGGWTLDKKLSDVAGNLPRGGEGRYRGGGSGGFPGGGGHGRGGGFHGGGGGAAGGHGADPEAATRRRDLLEAPDQMTIVQTDSMIVITARDGRTTRLSPDGKKIKDESTNIERKTRWEGGKLVSEISGAAGHATEIYSVNPAQHELLVVIRLESSGADETTRVLHRLYTLDAR